MGALTVQFDTSFHQILVGFSVSLAKVGVRNARGETSPAPTFTEFFFFYSRFLFTDYIKDLKVLLQTSLIN